MWMFLAGRNSLNVNNAMLLCSHKEIKHDDKTQIYAAPNVGEGSVVSLGNGEIGMSFGMLVTMQTKCDKHPFTGQNLCSILLHSELDRISLRICYDKIRTHKSFENRAFLCFPLRRSNKVKSTTNKNVVMIDDKVVLPEIVVDSQDNVTTFKFKCQIYPRSFTYDVLLQRFIHNFMSEHDDYVKKIDNTENDIMTKYTSQEAWKNIQHISSNEKYILVMLLGHDNALHILQHGEQKKRGQKRKKKQPPIITYQKIGEPITSVYSICFTLYRSMKVVYDMCYDVFLSIMAVASETSCWHNRDIKKDIAKILLVQHMIRLDADNVVDSKDDVLFLGDKVC